MITVPHRADPSENYETFALYVTLVISLKLSKLSMFNTNPFIIFPASL